MQALNELVLTHHNICTLDALYIYFVLVQPNMLVGGRRYAVEYFKAGRAVRKSDELSVVAKLLLNLSL